MYCVKNIEVLYITSMYSVSHTIMEGFWHIFLLLWCNIVECRHSFVGIHLRAVSTSSHTVPRCLMDLDWAVATPSFFSAALGSFHFA